VTATISSVPTGVNRGGRYGDALEPPPAFRRHSPAGPGPGRTGGRPAAGISVIDNGINIDNAFVLGPGLNSTLPVGGSAGVFVALLSQTSETLESVSAPGTASSATITGGPVDLAPQALVNLDGPAPQIVLSGLTRPLSGGETIQLVLTFSNVGAVTLNVPVEPRADTYATYSPPAIPSPTASASASGTATASPSATP
jgi:copper(I)-binding protein